MQRRTTVPVTVPPANQRQVQPARPDWVPAPVGGTRAGLTAHAKSGGLGRIVGMPGATGARIQDPYAYLEQVRSDAADGTSGQTTTSPTGQGEQYSRGMLLDEGVMPGSEQDPWRQTGVSGYLGPSTATRRLWGEMYAPATTATATAEQPVAASRLAELRRLRGTRQWTAALQAEYEQLEALASQQAASPVPVVAPPVSRYTGTTLPGGSAMRPTTPTPIYQPGQGRSQTPVAEPSPRQTDPLGMPIYVPAQRTRSGPGHASSGGQTAPRAAGPQIPVPVVTPGRRGRRVAW